MPRVLITGAAGFIGMHTSIRFLKEGWDVIGLDNMNNYYSVSLKRDRLKEITVITSKLEKTFTFIEADLNSDVWKELASYQLDGVIHLAAQAGVRYSIKNPTAYIESNISGFQRVIDFVNDHRIKNFVYASSSSVYGMDSEVPYSESEPCNNPESLYAATKKSNEMVAKSYWKVHKLPSVGLRFFTVYGPWGRPDMAPFMFTKAAFSNEKINVFNQGEQQRDFTYVDDIVNSIYLIYQERDSLFTGPEIINIGQGSPIGLLDFIETIERITNSKLKKKLLPAQPGDVVKTWADTKKLDSIIGFTQKTNIQDGLNKFIHWYKSYFVE